MSNSPSRHSQFRPSKPAVMTRTEVIDATARGIIEAETSLRQAKTARLRQMRETIGKLQPEPAAKKRVAKATKPPPAGGI